MTANFNYIRRYSQYKVSFYWRHRPVALRSPFIRFSSKHFVLSLACAIRCCQQMKTATPTQVKALPLSTICKTELRGTSVGQLCWTRRRSKINTFTSNTLGAFTNNLATAMAGCYKQDIIFNHTTKFLETGLYQFQITYNTFVAISNCRCQTICTACCLKSSVPISVSRG